MSNTINLDAKRAARAAARKEPLRIEIGDDTFELVYEMPIELGDLINENKFTDAFRMLLAHPDEDWHRLREYRPTYQDVADIMEFLGAALGESSASGAASTNTGGPSTPTGRATTDEISPPTYSVTQDMVHQVKDALTYGAS